MNEHVGVFIHRYPVVSARCWVRDDFQGVCRCRGRDAHAHEIYGCDTMLKRGDWLIDIPKEEWNDGVLVMSDYDFQMAYRPDEDLAV